MQNPNRLLSLVLLLACDHGGRRAPLDASEPEPQEHSDAGQEDLLDDASTDSKDAATDAEPAIEYPQEEPLYRSGTRLKALRLVPDSGEPIFMGWFDTQIGEPCSFVSTREGERCLPGMRHGHTFEAHFADDQCTTSHVDRPYMECVESSKYAWNKEAIVYEVEQIVTGSPIFVRRTNEQSDAGSCAPSTAGGHLFRTLRALPLSTFVAGATRTLPGGRLRRRVLESDDGALATTGVWDEERGVACTIRWDGRGDATCGEEKVEIQLQRVGDDRLQLLVQRSPEGYLLGPSASAHYEGATVPYAVTHHDRQLHTPCAPVKTAQGWLCAPTPVTPQRRCAYPHTRFAVPRSEQDYETSAIVCEEFNCRAPAVWLQSMGRELPLSDAASFELAVESL